jgi:hypothetical protein
VEGVEGDKQGIHAPDEPVHRGLHSSTFRLNVSAYYNRGCMQGLL